MDKNPPLTKNILTSSDNDTPNLSIEDLAVFLDPLIDILKCDRISLTEFRRNHKETISKLRETNRPVLLCVNGQHLLLCDAKTYFDLENTRQSIISQIESIDELQLGKIDFSEPSLVELGILRREVSDQNSRLKNLRWDMKQAKEKLEVASAKLAKFTTSWNKKKAANKTENISN